jgi:hypothetical protein
MGPARSGGPPGLDPGGKCPNNPTNNDPLSGSGDYDYVVNERIHDLKQRVHHAESEFEKVSPSKKKLARRLVRTHAKLMLAEHAIADVLRLLEKYKRQSFDLEQQDKLEYPACPKCESKDMIVMAGATHWYCQSCNWRFAEED